MNRSQPTPAVLLIRYARPWALLAGVLLYALGAGVVRYQGYPLDWPVYFLGQAVVTLLQISSYYLKVYYDLLADPRRRRGKQEEQADEEGTGPVDLPRPVVLQAAITALTIGAVVTVLLITQKAISLPTLVILSVAFLLAFFYAVPPIRLVYSGYGELSQAILITNLFPALAYLFQTGELHRLLGMLTFPLTALYLAMTLARQLPSYAADLRQNRQNLMVRLGWQRGMFFHNLLIFVAYLLLGFAALLGLPWGLTWPALLTLPVGLFQVWQMSRISGGAPPSWKLLTLSAIALVSITAYLITLALWTS